MVSRHECSDHQAGRRIAPGGETAHPGRFGRKSLIRGSLIRGGLILAAALALSAGAPRAAEIAPAGCESPASRLDISAGLARQLTQMVSDQTLTIVAFGSSSTQGHGASGPDHSYPALLAGYLREKFPGFQVQVINRGVGGDVVESMLARLQRDVIDSGADLVLWQTGTNDAIRGVPLERFATLLQEGLARLAAADIGVVLIDPQFYPDSSAITAYPAYVEAMDRIADSRDVGLFHRYAQMRELSQQQPESFAALLSADRFHQSDAGYACLARSLAEGLAAALQTQEAR